MNILLDGYFHTVWEAVTGHKLGHISAFDFWSTLAAIVAVVSWFEKKLGKNLGAKILVNYIKDFFGMPVQVKRLNLKVDAVQKEVQYNGGTVLLKDAVKDLKTVSGMIVSNQQISDEREKARIMLDPTPMFIEDSKGDVTLVNFAWCKMVGCVDGKEMLGNGWLRVMPNQKEAEERHKTTIGKPFTGEVVFKDLDGKRLIYTHCKTLVIKDAKGKVVETHGTLEITQIKNINNGNK